MITKNQANHLKTLIRQLVQAELADSWKGGGDPDDVPDIEKELIKCKRQIKQYIEHLQKE